MKNNWRDYLTPGEIAELDGIERAKVEGQQQARRIYDRCRKRMNRGVTYTIAHTNLAEAKNGEAK